MDLKGQSYEFGFYFNIEPVSGLGISGGYSGLYQEWNSKFNTNIRALPPQAQDEIRKYFFAYYNKAEFPFYHGIDLRFNYTGIRNLGITFNNNITFASVQGGFVQGDDAFELVRLSWTYDAYLDRYTDRSEHYFSLNNILGLRYDFSETLSADLQFANQLGIFTLSAPGMTASTIVNCLGIYTGINYRLIQNERFRASFRGGLALAMRLYSHQNPVVLTTSRAGFSDFSIPVGIRVEY